MARKNTNPDVEEMDDDQEDTTSGDVLALNISTTVKADAEGNRREFTGAVEVPTTVEGWTERFGDEMVLAFLKQSYRARVKSSIRPLVEGDTEEAEDGTKTNRIYTDDEIQDAANSYVPSLTQGRRGKTAAEKRADAINALSEDELQLLIQQAQEKLAASV